MSPHDTPLIDALELSQALGMLGQRPVVEVIDQAEAFVAALDAVGATNGVVVDLGSGGGVPGLVIAWRRPDLRLVLVDRRATRTDHLRRLVARLGLSGRVAVHDVDAHRLPRVLPSLVDAVVARGFGPPSAVLDAALPLLAEGGSLIVSEPPEPDPSRWPAGLLDRHGVARHPSPDDRVVIVRRVPSPTT